MKSTCGCCSGVQVATPQPEANRPGLPALSYRVGTYATFFESMVARLSSFPALKGLTTRELSDPSIAMLDAWAVVADVLTFYQERIANEGYLMTATERRSILELAKLVGYKLRPGVSASVYLAFTAATGFQGTIPAGTRAQSIPGTGQTAQFFETSVDLTVRDTWNALQPRLTRPQLITLAADRGTDAATRDTIYFQGISTNLKAGDMLLFVLGDDDGLQVPRFVQSVDAQADLKRTEVTLQPAPPQPGAALTAQSVLNAAVDPLIQDAQSIFPDSDLAARVAKILANLETNVAGAQSLQNAAEMVLEAIPQVQRQYDIAVGRGFTRLEAWTSDVLFTLAGLVQSIPNIDGDSQPTGQPLPPPATLPPSPLANLFNIIKPLSAPPSLQPANPQRLVRTIAQTFSPQADTAPRLLAAFQPAAADTIYQAWSGVSTPSPQVQVYAMRVKAAPFGATAPQQMSVPAVGGYPTPQEWGLAPGDIASTDPAEPSLLSLDATYDKIAPSGWAVINSPDYQQPIIAAVNGVQPIARANYGMTAKVTQLALDRQWLTGANNQAEAVPEAARPPAADDQIKAAALAPPPAPPLPSIAGLRNVTVWAQMDQLDLAEEPLDTDVKGDTIELAELYDGFESGRWIMVSGERTDIPNTTGVTATELVMIAGVKQGVRAPLSVPFPADYVPFQPGYYTTDANSQGDRLVVGKLAGRLPQSLPLPQFVNQQFSDQVQLAPGLYVTAYVPTSDELSGEFPAFKGLLIDPSTNVLFPGGFIPAGSDVFAWRISAAPVHTILTLANKLAYEYDSTNVTIYGNVAPATNGQTVGEVLGDGDGSQAFQSFALRQSPLTYVSAATPEGTASTLSVTVNDVGWPEADNLAALGPKDREFVTQTDDSDQTTMTFGNGVHGARVPTGTANVKAVYRYGIGSGGNVDAGQISQLATHPQGAQGVINPLPASGGADPDSISQARANTPMAVMALDRLVGTVDYANFSHTFAGIGKASAARISDGRRLVVHVTIAGAEDIPIDTTSNLYQNLVQALHQFGDPALAIQVAVRRLKLLVISAGVSLLANYQWESVEPEIRAAVLDLFSFDRRDLGQTAFLSELVSAIQGVEGVSYVNVQKFDAVSEDVTAAQLAGLAGTLRRHNAVRAQLARIDPNATGPAKRILPAELAILTPDIPDTLLLTEIQG